MPCLVIATGNHHKIGEFKSLLGVYQGQLLSLSDFDPAPAPEEDAPDYLGNALLKAHYYARITGLPCLADDSGLEVDALDGRPGVLSARYGGKGLSSTQKVARLLAEIEQVSAPGRTARFRCVVALASPEGKTITAEGVSEGTLCLSPRGPGGFGYDPIFIPDGHTKAFSEIPASAKNLISHRGIALRKLLSHP
jgi:XTP/dITP diphosphohydrolase